MSNTDLAEETVQLNVLVGLIEGLETKVSRHEFDGTAEEYRGYHKAHEEVIKAIEQIVDMRIDEPVEEVIERPDVQR